MQTLQYCCTHILYSITSQFIQTLGHRNAVQLLIPGWLIVTSTMEWCNTSVLCIIVWSIIIQCNIASTITELITGGCTMEWILFCNICPLTHITAMLMSN